MTNAENTPQGAGQHPLGLGERVRLARCYEGLTQQELAGDSFSKSYISAVEQGKIKPSLPTLTRLAERLDWPVSYFAGQDEVPSKKFDYLLAGVEAALRHDDPKSALALLDSKEDPPPYLPVATRLYWYALAAWANGMAGRSVLARGFVERGMALAEQPQVQVAYPADTRLATSVAYMVCMKGNAFCDKSDHEQAYIYHQRALDIIFAAGVTDPTLKLLAYKGLGLDAYCLERYDEAILHYKKAVQQAEDLDNPRQQGMMYWGLAAAYQDQGNPFHAKINYQKALSFLEETENAGLLALIRALLGQALMNVGDHEEAEQYLRKSLAGARAEKYVIALKLALSNMAAFHNAQSEPDQALPLAAEALQIALESEDRQFEVQLSLILATSYTIKNNLPQAEQVITRAIQVAQQISVPKLLRQGHEHLAEFFRVQGRLEEAFNRMLLANASLGAAN